MAKIDYSALAAAIMENVGGSGNVHTVSHCVTRLRFVLKDRSMAKDAEIKQLTGVLGVVYGSGQYQVILGENLFPVFDEIVKNYEVETGDVVAENHTEDLALNGKKKTIKDYFMKAIQFMSASLTPFITVLFGAGMLRVILSLASYFYPAVTSSTTYMLFNFMSQAPFYFMPILVAYGASRVLKSNPAFAITVAAALLYPDFAAMVAAGDPVTMLGLPVKLVSYSSSLLPAIFSAILLAYLEKFFYRVIPGMLRSVFAPLCVFLVGYPVTILILGPAGVVVGTWIVTGIVWLQAHVGGFAPGIIAAIHPFLVMMGVNMLMVAPMTELFTSVGYDNVFRPGWILHNIAEGGSCLAVMLKTKDKDLKSSALSAAIGAIISGVSEPALYGINLRLRTPIFGVVAGGLVGGAVAGFMGAKAFSMGYSSILGVVIFENTITAIVAGVIAAFFVSFLATFVLYNGKTVND
ncbi:PTS transporter subunit EIIC [uncultured Holdemania sp.]|uniref:PTS transporter subunit EIIC n=1 Tax=uncultured Holdemania sp. TaxID=527664 RepID=UPI002805648A|nr:PTS transporter subunit EIIC [uncultured Holdemania sp.]